MMRFDKLREIARFLESQYAEPVPLVSGYAQIERDTVRAIHKASEKLLRAVNAIEATERKQARTSVQSVV